MTIGDIEQSLKRIKELESRIQEILANYEDYINADGMIHELEIVLDMERSKSFGVK